MVGTGKLDIAPVYVGDIVNAIVAALERPEISAGKVYTLAGPTATFDEVIEGVLEHLGSRKPKLHIPGPAALALACALARLPNPPVTRDNVLGLIQAAGIASLVFGLGHAYQGWKGMLLTGVVGAFLAVLYLVSGSLIAPMILHALMDMRSGQLAYVALSREVTQEDALGGAAGADEPGSVPDRGGVTGPGA